MLWLSSFCNECVNRFRVQYDRLRAVNGYAYVILVMCVKIYMSVYQQQQQKQYQTVDNIEFNVRRRNETYTKRIRGYLLMRDRHSSLNALKEWNALQSDKRFFLCFVLSLFLSLSSSLFHHWYRFKSWMNWNALKMEHHTYFMILL